MAIKGTFDEFCPDCGARQIDGFWPDDSPKGFSKCNCKYDPLRGPPDPPRPLRQGQALVNHNDPSAVSI